MVEEFLDVGAADLAAHLHLLERAYHLWLNASTLGDDASLNFVCGGAQVYRWLKEARKAATLPSSGTMSVSFMFSRTAKCSVFNYWIVCGLWESEASSGFGFYWTH
eukprot:3774324-Amphidinium_carterae.1